MSATITAIPSLTALDPACYTNNSAISSFDLLLLCQGRMVGLLRAGPTPKKPQRRQRKTGQSRRHTQEDLSRKLKRARTDEEDSDSDAMGRKLPPPTIPAQYKYLDR